MWEDVTAKLLQLYVATLWPGAHNTGQAAPARPARNYDLEDGASRCRRGA